MTRLPFDPEKIRTPEAGGPARREQARYGALQGGQTLSVSQVCELIKRVLADRTPAALRVAGEVSNFSERTHWYFSIKDQASVLACVMWGSAARKAGFQPRQGQQVVATGRLDYFGPQGRLQMYVDTIEPVGTGALELRMRQLMEELRGKGYFAQERKKEMPAFAQRIAVVTSATGAALADVVKTARQRWAGVELWVVDVRVQGEGAAEQVARAIRALSEHHARWGIEAAIVTRGGGSLEDLWAFNERVVADALFECRLPVVAAIGHETDTTVAELVADLRASTPTQAAARLVVDAATERQRLGQIGERLRQGLRRSAQHQRQRLESLARHPVFRRPIDAVALRRDALVTLQQRLATMMRQRVSDLRSQLQRSQLQIGRIEPAGLLKLGRHQVESALRRIMQAAARRSASDRQRLGALEQRLKAVGPVSVLERGYSFTTGADGRLIRSVQQAPPGSALLTHLKDGQVRSVVSDGAPPPQAQSKPRRPPSPPADSPGGLFG
jgi:exodeoxyribonuclease VII large subunit